MARLSKADLGGMLAIVLGWAALCAAADPRGDFPLNDDWTYGLAVKSILATGRFTLISWSAANVILQAYWGAAFCALFGFSYETLRVSTFVLGEAGLLASYALLRELGVSTRMTVLGTVAIGCNPLYFSQALTFMTDVPFTATIAAAMLLFVRGSVRERARLRWAGYALGLLAVLIRQFAIVLPVAFAAASLRRRALSIRRAAGLVAAVLLFAALHVAFQRWMVATHRTGNFELTLGAVLQLSPRAAIARVAPSVLPMIAAIGLCVLPLAAIDPSLFWRRPVTRAIRLRTVALTSAVAAAFGLALLATSRFPPLLGNLLQPFGIGPLTLTDTYVELQHLPTTPGSTTIWAVLIAGSCWAVAIAALAVLRALADIAAGGRAGTVAAQTQAMLLTFGAAYLVAVLTLGTIGIVFDRYLATVLPVLVAIVLVGSSDRGRAAFLVSAGLIAAMAMLSLLGTHDWFAFNRARWVALDGLTARGVPPTAIDGGYEFNGPATFRPGPVQPFGKPGWWVVDNQYIVAAGPQDGYREIASYPVATWLWRTGTRIVVLEREAVTAPRAAPGG